MLTSDSEIIRLGTMYIRASFAMVLFIDGIFTLASMFRGAGEPGYSLMGMIVNTIGVVLSIPLLVYGAGPLPALGLAGTPLGLGAGRLLGVLLMLYFLFSGRCRIRLKLAHLRPHPAHLFRIIELGWPVWAQNLFERTANLVLISLISPFGALALAAWGVGNRVSQMGRMPGFALQGAVRTMVGQNIGGRRPDRARVAAWITISIVFSILLLTTIALFIWAEQIIHFFGLKGAAAPAGVICFRILCIGTLFEGTRRVVAGVFEGASQTKPPMFVEAIVRWMVMLPMAYVASTLFGMAEIGIWWAVSGSQVLGGLALFIWFVFGWRRKAYQENQVG
jgi:putative MATE family efflux protein